METKIQPWVHIVNFGKLGGRGEAGCCAEYLSIHGVVSPDSKEIAVHKNVLRSNLVLRLTVDIDGILSIAIKS